VDDGVPHQLLLVAVKHTLRSKESSSSSSSSSMKKEISCCFRTSADTQHVGDMQRTGSRSRTSTTAAVNTCHQHNTGTLHILRGAAAFLVHKQLVIELQLCATNDLTPVKACAPGTP
jgi:hypothetical protein